MKFRLFHLILVALVMACGTLNPWHASGTPKISPEALSVLAENSEADPGLLRQIAAILTKLRKHLILEETRGVREVSLYRDSAPAVVLVVTKNGLGSGTIIDDSAHVLTNWHVVAGYSRVAVVFKPKKGEDLQEDLIRSATVERIDEVSDLALLKVISPPRPFATIALGEPSSLEVGQDVFAIGHPRGEVWTFTKGIISQIWPKYQWPNSNPRHQATVIQTQTPINPGSSGGPLLDEHGRLIGVNTFINADSPGLNYAVAVDTVQQFLQNTVTPRPRPPTPEQAQLNCPESYDTLAKGWDNVFGCYSEKRVTPPPDYWLVFRNAEATSLYGVQGLVTKDRLDTIFQPSSTRPGEIEWYFDTNCDDLVDLIGYQPAGSSSIERYSFAIAPFYLTFKAKELHEALTLRRIPYPDVRFCQ